MITVPFNIAIFVYLQYPHFQMHSYITQVEYCSTCDIEIVN